LLTTVLILLSKYFCRPTLNKIRENIAINIEGNKVVVEKKVYTLNLFEILLYLSVFHLKSYKFDK